VRTPRLAGTCGSILSYSLGTRPVVVERRFPTRARRAKPRLAGPLPGQGRAGDPRAWEGLGGEWSGTDVRGDGDISAGLRPRARRHCPNGRSRGHRQGDGGQFLFSSDREGSKKGTGLHPPAVANPRASCRGRGVLLIRAEIRPVRTIAVVRGRVGGVPAGRIPRIRRSRGVHRRVAPVSRRSAAIAGSVVGRSIRQEC